jgi:hypothetical protein
VALPTAAAIGEDWPPTRLADGAAAAASSARIERAKTKAPPKKPAPRKFFGFIELKNKKLSQGGNRKKSGKSVFKIHPPRFFNCKQGFQIKTRTLEPTLSKKAPPNPRNAMPRL